MSTDLAPIEINTLPADAWIHSGAALDHHAGQKGRITQADIDRSRAEFLARGGQIQVIPQGVSVDTVFFNNRVVMGATPQSPFTRDERIRHAKEADAAVRRRIIAGDAEWIAKIAVNLPACKTARDLCKVCGMSADKLDRLLRTYFADNDQAKLLMKRNRSAKEEIIRERYPLLRHTMSLTDCARELHTTNVELKRVIALHGLDKHPSLMEEVAA